MLDPDSHETLTKLGSRNSHETLTKLDDLTQQTDCISMQFDPQNNPDRMSNQDLTQQTDCISMQFDPKNVLDPDSHETLTKLSRNSHETPKSCETKENMKNT